MYSENGIQRVVVITGASKGIGAAAGRRFAMQGCIVYDLSRSGGNKNCRHIPCDVSRSEDIEAAISRIIRENGRIDIAVSNAGFGISGSVECTGYESIKNQIDVNFTGSACFAKAVLPHIRKSRGRLIFISSVAGAVPIPFQALYSASKAAVASLALALDNEIRPSGARVITVMPGDIATAFTASRRKNLYEDSFYEQRAAASVGRMERDELKGKGPELIAEKIYQLAVASRPALISTSGMLYRLALLLVKILPAAIYNRILFGLYGK